MALLLINRFGYKNRGISSEGGGGSLRSDADFFFGVIAADREDFAEGFGSCIILLAEVGEHYFFASAVEEVFNEGGTIGIGEVTFAGHYSFFQVGRVHTEDEHIEVMICLTDDIAAAFYGRQDVRGEEAGIGGGGEDLFTVNADEVADASDAVMREGEGGYADICERMRIEEGMFDYSGFEGGVF